VKAASASRWYRKMAAEGRCTSCGQPAVPGRQLCEPHLLEKRTKNVALYRAGRANLRVYACSRCGAAGHNSRTCLHAPPATRKPRARRAQGTASAVLSLTEKQNAVLTFIHWHRREIGFSPTSREICAHFGFSSTNAAHCVVQQLARKRAIQITPHIARSIVPLMEPAR
jgi:hypothetical protein